jgi:geranylgeranyl diphosphate synthase type II
VLSAFARERAAIETALADVCVSHLKGLPSETEAAIRYALNSPGKRLRPLLAVYAYRACGGLGDIIPLSCAVEVIHAYSLVHDDLPCMDDDDFRRGRPTVHKVYGAQTAILAGVAMIPLAVAVIRDASRSMRLARAVKESIVRALLHGAGLGGMIGGQARDLSGEGLSLSLEEREEIHRAKTGALIVASLRIGALAAQASSAKLRALEQYGAAIGLAFQITDDVLDVTATTSTLGKTAGRDVALGKSTYPALLGIDGAQSRAQTLVTDGLRALEEEKLLTHELSQVANFVVTRTS